MQIYFCRPEKDPKQEKMLTRLRQDSNIDELLQAQSRFLTVTDAEVCDSNYSCNTLTSPLNQSSSNHQRLELHPLQKLTYDRLKAEIPTASSFMQIHFFFHRCLSLSGIHMLQEEISPSVYSICQQMFNFVEIYWVISLNNVDNFEIVHKTRLISVWGTVHP